MDIQRSEYKVYDSFTLFGKKHHSTKFSNFLHSDTNLSSTKLKCHDLYKTLLTTTYAKVAKFRLINFVSNTTTTSEIKPWLFSNMYQQQIRIK